MSLETIHAAATALEGQAIGLKTLIATREALGAGRWPAWNIEWNRSELAKLRAGYRILKWFVQHPEQIPPGLAAYIEGWGE